MSKCYSVYGIVSTTKGDRWHRLSIPLRKSDAIDFRIELKQDGKYRKLEIRKVSCL